MFLKLYHCGSITLASACVFFSLSLQAAWADNFIDENLVKAKFLAKDIGASRGEIPTQGQNVELFLENLTKEPVIVVVHRNPDDPDDYIRLDIHDNKVMLAPGFKYNLYVYAGDWVDGFLEPKYRWGPNDLIAQPEAVIEWQLKPQKAYKLK